MPSRAILRAVLMACLASYAFAQSLDQLKVGHWVEAKGEIVRKGVFRAAALEVLPPSDEETLIGTVEDVSRRDERFVLLGLVVTLSDKTELKDVALADLRGKRVKVEGHYRGGDRFSARQITTRGEGRDRVVGRIDQLVKREGVVEAQIMGFTVELFADAKFENESSFESLPLAPEVEFETASGIRPDDDDDYIPGTIRLSDSLSLGGLFEYKGIHEDNYDLDDADREDDTDHRVSLRAQLLWTPTEDLHALLDGRFEFQDQREEGTGHDRSSDWLVNEAWVGWRDIGDTGIELRTGRQDFDDRREWLYDQNLDAARLIWRGEAARLELSASTRLADGSERDENTTNYIAYLSNNDPKKHLAAYAIDRRDDRSPRDYPIHFGARALGEFLPDNKSWLEASVLRGYSENVNLEGYGFDVGTTWSPSFVDPVSLTLGFAYGSGDDDPSDSTDGAFRQTGLQDNNAKFAGVTSFRYYGEIVDPELSNLAILTVGIGTRIARKTSIDLVYHRFDQVEAADFLRDSDLDADPDGVHSYLGQEFDLILGTRAWKPFDFEFVLGWFDPGTAFPDGDEAWLGSFQVRYRF